MRPLLEVKDLHVHYVMPKKVVKAVDGVSFTLGRGEVLGIGGESGCGKSTLAYAIMRLVPPPGRIVKGKVVLDGKDITSMDEDVLRKEVRWKEVSMVFQGAMNALCPVFTVEHQLITPLIYHLGMSRSEAIERAKEVLELVGLPSSILRRYPHELSGGQKQRVVIAMAIIMNPKLIIADEPTTALDVVVQAQIMNLFKKLKRELSSSFIFITHDLSLLAEIADKVGIMYGGKLVELGPSEVMFKEPKHPYTKLLLESIPKVGVKKLKWIAGTPPDLSNPPPGCRFWPRCPYVTERCRREEPPTVEVGKGHVVTCWLYGG